MQLPYINTDERYGEQVETTLADYQELNPDGTFIKATDGIREYHSDKPGDYTVVAVQLDKL